MKTLKCISVFCFFNFLISGNLSGQDLLYKKNSAVLKVTFVSFDQKTVSYKIPSDTMGYIYLISKEAIDSIVLSDGRSFKYQKPETIFQKKIKRNYIGIDLFETFIDYTEGFRVGLNNLHVSFERISPSGKTSFSAELLLNIEYLNSEKPDYPWVSDPRWEGNWVFWNGWHWSYDPYCYFVKAGINVYPFNYSLARIGTIRFFTGASLLAGKIQKEEYNEYYYPLYNKVFTASFVWNIDARFYLTDVIQVKGGIDISVLPFLVFWSPEIGLSISF